MEDIIIIIIIAAIVLLAGGYIYKAKKSGKKCIGCPEGCSCIKKDKNGYCCGCSENKEE